MGSFLKEISMNRPTFLLFDSTWQCETIFSTNSRFSRQCRADRGLIMFLFFTSSSQFQLSPPRANGYIYSLIVRIYIQICIESAEVHYLCKYISRMQNTYSYIILYNFLHLPNLFYNRISNRIARLLNKLHFHVLCCQQSILDTINNF